MRHSIFGLNKAGARRRSYILAGRLMVDWFELLADEELEEFESIVTGALATSSGNKSDSLPFSTPFNGSVRLYRQCSIGKEKIKIKIVNKNKN